ncbi:hypothetical protein HD554DRAFT_2040681 [Boletus coccyginus]|nr:hypothetical protein HD554DRAFT_2040681 [Boletus coccyginus]
MSRSDNDVIRVNATGTRSLQSATTVIVPLSRICGSAIIAGLRSKPNAIRSRLRVYIYSPRVNGAQTLGSCSQTDSDVIRVTPLQAPDRRVMSESSLSTRVVHAGDVWGRMDTWGNRSPHTQGRLFWADAPFFFVPKDPSKHGKEGDHVILNLSSSLSDEAHRRDPPASNLNAGGIAHDAEVGGFVSACVSRPDEHQGLYSMEADGYTILALIKCTSSSLRRRKGRVSNFSGFLDTWLVHRLFDVADLIAMRWVLGMSNFSGVTYSVFHVGTSTAGSGVRIADIFLRSDRVFIWRTRWPISNMDRIGGKAAWIFIFEPGLTTVVAGLSRFCNIVDFPDDATFFHRG